MATQKLKNIRLVVAGDVYEWMRKVKTLIDEGADIRVLDNYKGEGSIVTAYILSGMDTGRLYDVVRFLFEQGVAPTPGVFVDALLAADTSITNLVMKAANGTIDVNTLDIYGESSHDWVLRNTITGKRPEAIKYLASTGLRTSTKSISLDDVMKIMGRVTVRG